MIPHPQLPRRRRPLLHLILLLGAMLAWTGATRGVAADAPAPATSTAENPFLARMHTNASGAVLRYRVLLPRPVDPAVEYPVIVFLHGAGARGEDNEEPLNWGPRLMRDSLERDRLPAVILVPQCPKGSGWTGSAFTARGADPLSLTLEVVKDVLPRELKLDVRRRYLTGASMGGIALYGYLTEHPGFFAAGVPVCSAGNPSEVTPEAARHPIWAFHSDDDHLIDVAGARAMVKAWQAKGGVAKYTEYTGLRHSSWKKAYIDPDLFRWLFDQRLPAPR